MGIPVRLWFDYISPYSYLALTRAERFAAEHGVSWAVRPVFYGAVLDATGLSGPAEIPIKREYTLNDVVRAAELLGAALVGPPAHPFRSLEALRATCLFLDDPRALTLVVALSTAAWGEGRDLTRWETIHEVVDSVGLDGSDLEARAADAGKEVLRRTTGQALEAGVFGVPTFGLPDGELFWGHDRLDHLAARLSGRLPETAQRSEEIAARPRGVDRPGVAERFERA
ncbi:MAG TPA: 2-hydroxychromene-2-carboxylate isomerase [Gemmatimonadota bacterium]|nr:2-hydroxychromene-2-carboxylate isomerase [Gemmatimonadota bacterium]